MGAAFALRTLTWPLGPACCSEHANTSQDLFRKWEYYLLKMWNARVKEKRFRRRQNPWGYLTQELSVLPAPLFKGLICSKNLFQYDLKTCGYFPSMIRPWLCTWLLWTLFKFLTLSLCYGVALGIMENIMSSPHWPAESPMGNTIQMTICCCEHGIL